MLGWYRSIHSRKLDVAEKALRRPNWSATWRAGA